MDPKQLIKSFIIGSSIPAFIILFIVVIYLFKIKKATFDYYRYSILAPIGMGLLSLIAKFISIKYNISLKLCYFIVSLFSALFVSINISREEGAYNFKTKNRWYLQYLLIFIGHLFIYNCIIYPLDLYLN